MEVQVGDGRVWVVWGGKAFAFGCRVGSAACGGNRGGGGAVNKEDGGGEGGVDLGLDGGHAGTYDWGRV